jgi:iron complex outermembrane receptor protein
VHCQITGYILDSNTGDPISEVAISSLNQYTISDSTGYFILDTKPKDTLKFNHISYQLFKHILEKRDKELKIYLLPKQNYLDQVIVNAPFFQHKLAKIPTNFSLLQKKEIEFGNNMDYPDILNLVPGVFVHSGSPGTKRITIRGIGSRIPYSTNRIKVYLNYIPITSADGTTSIEDLDLSLINRIEILKGAKSALYNSGLGGAILLKTPAKLKQGFHGSTNSVVGSFRTFRFSSHLSYAGKDLSIAGFFSNSGSDGYRKNSQFTKKNALLTANYEVNKNHEISFLFYFSDGKLFIPSSLDFETYQNNPENAAINWLTIKGFEKYSKINVGLKHHFQISQNISIHNILYSNILDSYESRPFNILDDNSLRKGVKTYIQLSSNRMSLQGGVDIMDDKYEWSVFETNVGIKGFLQDYFKETRKNLNSFIHINYKVSDMLLFESGLNINKISYTLTDLLPDSIDLSGHFAFDHIVSPFLGANYQFKNYFLFYTSISHGFSPPTLEETLLPKGQLNPWLKPETGINADFGIRFAPFGTKLYTDINYYIIWIKNLLVTKRISEELFMGQNAGKSFHKGIEISTYFFINEDYKNKVPAILIRGTMSLSTNYFVNFIDDGNNFSGNHLPGIPRQTYTLSSAIKTKLGLYLNSQFRYLSSQFLNDANDNKSTPYFLINLKTGFIKHLYNYKFELNAFFGIDNLTDSHYASMILINAPQFENKPPRYYYPGMPRNMYIGVSLNF